MSLYDDIDVDNLGQKKSEISGWGSSMKLLETQKHLQEKKLLQSGVKRRQQQPMLPPVIDLKAKRNGGGDGGGNSAPNRIQRLDHLGNYSSYIGGGGVVGGFAGIVDEYDPLRPNDYEKCLKLRKSAEEIKPSQRSSDNNNNQNNLDEDLHHRPTGWRSGPLQEDRTNFKSRDNNNDDGGGDEDEYQNRKRKRYDEESEKYKMGPKAAIAPPSYAYDSPTGASSKADSSGSVALKIMARMGYKDGQGLGKSEQGMSIALQVEKTSKVFGKIIHEKDLHKSQDTSVPRAETSNANLLINPSKVIVLRNMVIPGEVDGMLEAEVSEECSKYGKVQKCVIFELPLNTEDEAVRIFVEFDRLEASIKAVVDLNGRFFGGRVVKGNFYNVEKFRRSELADDIL